MCLGFLFLLKYIELNTLVSSILSDMRNLALMQGTFQPSNKLIIGLSQPQTAGMAVLLLQTSFAFGVKKVTFICVNDSYCKGVASLT